MGWALNDQKVTKICFPYLFRIKGVFSNALMGWRNECYEIRNKFEDPTLFRLERAASPLMGVRKYGIQINGFVRHKKLGTCLWFQQRSLHKPTWPGILLIETKEDRGCPTNQIKNILS